jgi:hypothetical protein
VVPAGDYLKLWDTKQQQLDYIKHHMTQGQLYNHWGRVDDDLTLDAKQVEDMLALRPVFYDEHAVSGAGIKEPGGISRAAVRDRAETPGAAVRDMAANREANAHTHTENVSGTFGLKQCLPEVGVHQVMVNAGNVCIAPAHAEGAGRRRGENAAPPSGDSKVRKAAARVNDATLSLSEARAADRAYNRTVFAAAGVTEMRAARQEDGEGVGVEVGGARGRRQKRRARSRIELQKAMQKMSRR